jgi:hypothetical protein
MEPAEDYDLWRRLSSMTRLQNLQDVLLYLRKHESNVSIVHLERQQQNRVRIGQRMMAEVLGEDVPLDLVQQALNQESDTPNDIHQVARLIHRLCQASVTDSALSKTEERTIRRDAVGRLFRLARPRPSVHLWHVIGWVCRLEPVFAGRAAAGQLRRVVRKWLT